MATAKKTTRTTKTAAKKTATRKTARGNTKNDGPTQIIARQASEAPAKVKKAGQAVATTVSDKTKVVRDFLAEHPKVAASLAAGIITVGSALLAKKLQNGSTPKTAEGAARQIAEAVQKILNK